MLTIDASTAKWIAATAVSGTEASPRPMLRAATTEASEQFWGMAFLGVVENDYGIHIGAWVGHQ